MKNIIVERNDRTFAALGLDMVKNYIDNKIVITGLTARIVTSNRNGPGLCLVDLAALFFINDEFRVRANDKGIGYRISTNAQGYATFNDNKAAYSGGRMGITRIHNLILGPSKDQPVDHINHKRFDNRLANIRVCTGHQDNANNRFNIYEEHNTGIVIAECGDVVFQAPTEFAVLNMLREYLEEIAPKYSGPQAEMYDEKGWHEGIYPVIDDYIDLANEIYFLI